MMISTRTPAARLFATAIALTPACVEQSVDVEVNVTAAPDDDDDAPAGDSTGAADEDDGDASTSTSGTGDGVEEDSSGGQPEPPEQPEPGPEHLPECGDGLVEGDEECDADAAPLCELDGFECKWRRSLFLSSERRTAAGWAADPDAADALCRADAAAAGLPAASGYRAFLSRGDAPPAWPKPVAALRSTCSGARLDHDPWSPGFVLQLELVAPADWPTCDAAGEPVQVLGLPPTGLRAAWWSFSAGSGGQVSGTCAPGEDFGYGGVAIDGVPPQEDSEARLDGRTLPCAAALPVLCGAS